MSDPFSATINTFYVRSLDMNDTINLTPSQIRELSQCMLDQRLSIRGAMEVLNSNIKAKQQKLLELQKLDPRIMSKKEVIEATWKLPELPTNTYRLLNEQGGFMTGSNVISGISDPKDEDWCIPVSPQAFAKYSLGQSDHGYWGADGFSSVYCHYHGRLINIICFSDDRLFDAWYVATEIMNKLKTTSVPTLSTFYNIWIGKDMSDMFADKWKRVILFKALKDIAYEPTNKHMMPKEDAIKYQKCRECSREAIYFTCKAAKDYYQQTTICERCAGITY